MNAHGFQKLSDAKSALLAAEAAHPDSEELKALHASLLTAAGAFQNMLTDDQYQTLSGGKHEDPAA